MIGIERLDSRRRIGHVVAGIAAFSIERALEQTTAPRILGRGVHRIIPHQPVGRAGGKKIGVLRTDIDHASKGDDADPHTVDRVFHHAINRIQRIHESRGRLLHQVNTPGSVYKLAHGNRVIQRHGNFKIGLAADR